MLAVSATRFLAVWSSRRVQHHIFSVHWLGQSVPFHKGIPKRSFHLTPISFQQSDHPPLVAVPSSNGSHNEDFGSSVTENQKVATDTLILRTVCTRLLSEGVEDVEKIAKEIAMEIGTSARIWTSVIELDSDSLKKKLNLLQEVGCTIMQVLEHPGVLRFDEVELKKRVRKIRMENLGPVTVQNIFSMHAKHRKQKTSPYLSEGKSWLEILSGKLQCSISELLRETPTQANCLCTRFPERVIEKIDILLNGGFSTEQIRGCLRVLNKSVAALQKRTVELGKLGLQDQQTCSWLLQGEPEYQRIIRNASELQHCGDKLTYLSKLLDLPLEKTKDFVKHFDLMSVVTKVETLKEMGFTGKEIVNRPRLLKLSVNRLKKVLNIVKENELNDLCTAQRAHLVVHSTPNIALRFFSQKRVLSQILDCSISDIQRCQSHLKPALSHTDSMLVASVEFLEHKGFSKRHVLECPLLLNHEPSVLSCYLDCLEGRPELHPIEGWKRDPVKLLNALQYLIEKDVNFSLCGCSETIDSQLEEEHDTDL